MRKIYCLPALLLVLCLALPAAADVAPSGSIVDNQGKQIKVDKFEKLLDTYPFVYNDSEMSVPIKDVKSLTYVEGGKVLLENTKGKKFTVVGEMGICFTDLIHYQATDPISGQPQNQTIDPLFVRKIVFDWPKN